MFDDLNKYINENGIAINNEILEKFLIYIMNLKI